MSTGTQHTVSLKITADTSQHNAAFNGAAQAVKTYGSDVQASATSAATGLQRVLSQAERVAPALGQASATTQASLKTTQTTAQSLTQTLGGVGDAAQKAGTASAQGLNQATLSAKQYQAALRGVPAQFTDIFTSLASGQAPLTVLMQQGGQLKDMFGGAGNAARALSGYIMGLITPMTATAAAAALLAAGLYAGAQESRTLQNAIIASGNAAGVTQGQLMGMASGVDAVVGTQGRAVEVLAAFVATGKVGAAHLQEFTTAAMRFEAVGGAAAEDTVKAFVELGKAPLEGSLKLNESMHHLTTSTYEQIKALVEQGKHTQAVAVAQTALADTLNSRSGQMAQNLGLVEKAWLGIRNVVSETWDAIKRFGRDTGSEGALKSAQAAVDTLQAKLDSRKARGLATGDIEPQLVAAKALLEVKKQEVEQTQKAAAAQATQAALTEKKAAWDKQGETLTSEAQKRTEAITKARTEGQALLNAGLITETDLRKRIAAIEEKHADKTKTGDTELANLVARVAAEKQNLALLQTQGLHYDKINEGERTALQLTEQLTGKLDAKTRKSKEAQLVQAKALADVLNQQEAERQLQQARTAAAALDERLTTQQIAQYQQAIDQLVTGNEQLRTEIDLIGKDTAARRLYLEAKAQELITAKELEAITLRNAGASQAVIDKAEQELRLLRDKATLTAQVNSAQDGQAAKDMLQAIQRETEALGQGNEERQITIALRELEAKGIKAGSAAYDEYIPKIRAALHDKAVAEQSVAFWGSVENVAHDAWNHIGDQGESAAKRIERALKASVWDMLWQITGRRWLIDMGASLGVPGAALAQSQSGFGGSAIGTAANLYNLYGAAGTAGGFIGSIGSAASYGTAIGSQQGAMLAAQEMGMGTMAGSMSSIGAALPWIGGALALVSLIKSLDDSGTMHTGGAALADSITGVKEIQAATVGFGLAAADVSSKVVDSSKKLATSALDVLRGLDALSGGKNQFAVATGFADDTSKDGAWGSLSITRNGQSLVDWRDTQTSRWAPKEFADGEEGAKQYGNALAAGIKQAIDQIDLPDWAAAVVAQMGDSPTMDELSATLAKIQAMPEQALQAIGTSSQALGQIIYTGMQTSDPAGAGAAFAGQITHGIEASLYSGFSQQITGIISTQLVTPVVTAMASGATITEAMATVSIDAMKAQVAAAGAALAAIVNDSGFKDALASVNTLISDAVGSSIASFTAPTAPTAYSGPPIAPPPPAPPTPPTTFHAAAATDLGNAVDTLAQKFAQATDTLTTTGADLAVQLLRAQGDEAGALAAERSQYLAQYSDLAQAEQSRIAQLYDSNQAIRAQISLQERQQEITEERTGLQAQIDALTLSRSELLAQERLTVDASNRDLFDRLQLLQDEQRIADQRTDLEGQWLQAIRATARLRERELASIDPANRALQQLIYRLSDMQTTADQASARLDSSFTVLQRAVQTQKEALNAAHEEAKKAADQQAEALSESQAGIQHVFDALKAAIKSTTVETDALTRARRASAFAALQAAAAQASAGVSVDQINGLNDALDTLTGDSRGLYARYDDYVKAQDATADLMRRLQGKAGDQLDVTSAALKVARDSASTLDDQYELALRALDAEQTYWQTTLDAQRGIDTRVLSVKEAVDEMRLALTQAQATTAAASSAASLSAYTPTQVVGAVDYVRQAAAAGDLMGIYQNAMASGLNVEQVTAVIGLAGYDTVGTDDVRSWVSANGLAALPEASRRFAVGGAFTGGGIVQRPTHFDIGQMAEEGPEAIMPLANVNGRLGVRAHSAGSSPELVEAILAQNALLDRIAAAAEAGAVHGYSAARAAQELVDRGVKVIPGLKPLKMEMVA